MEYSGWIKEIGRGQSGARGLDRASAAALYGAMLDGQVPDLEMGALLLSLRIKTESQDELLGFLDAVGARMPRLRAPDGAARPLVLPTYNGARRNANLTPLLALLLAKCGVPVLLQGVRADSRRVTTAAILRRLGVVPDESCAAAEQALGARGLAFLPIDVLCPPLSRLLGYRARLGVRNSAHSLAKMLDPFAGGVRLVSVSHPDYITKMRGVFTTLGADALILRGTEGEPFANPNRCPQIEWARAGTATVLAPAQAGSLDRLPALPDGLDADATATWIDAALAGRAPVPEPIIVEAGCALIACGAAADLSAACDLVRARCGG